MSPRASRTTASTTDTVSVTSTLTIDVVGDG
jgi:hypothetical protein